MLKRSYRKLILSIAVAFGLVAFAGQAQAQKPTHGCVPAFEGLDQWIIRYDPNTGMNTVQQFDLRLTNTGDLSCTGRLRATSSTNEPFLTAEVGSAKVRYQLLDRTNADITPSPSDPMHTRTYTVGKLGMSAIPILFSIDPGTTVAAGRYTQQIMLEYVNGSQIIASKPVTLVLEVNSSVLIGLTGRFTRQGGIPTIDLGELVQSTRSDPGVAVYVRSSGPYRMTVTSLNGGKLRHENTDWSIDYGLRMGTQNIVLTGPHQITVPALQSHSDNYPLLFNIGETTGRRAGRYSDTLNFTIAAI